VFVLITQDYTCLGGGVWPAANEYPGMGLYMTGQVLEIPREWYNEQTMTRLGLLPPKNSPLGLTNPWVAALIPWSKISPGSPPVNPE
jgi:hypothetical protein